MSEPVFERHARTLTLAEIAALIGAEPPPAPLSARIIGDVAPLNRASPGAIAVFDDSADIASAAASHAGACLTTPALAKQLPRRVHALVVADPFRAFVEVARALYPHALRPSSLAEPGSIAGANVHPSVRLESGVTVEPGAVIGPRAEIGEGTTIGATAVIGTDVRIGRNCAIGAGTVMTDALLGDRVIVHSGCRIGQEGFGLVPGAGAGRKMPQVGRVIIQDGVEIGAGTTIDRGGIGDTVIGEGSKIDNLVQVGQNASVGRHCIVAAQAGIPGCAVLEDYAMLGARENLDP
ncbi:MAG TPA: UDP-3-O-(3-hydroxymyristoyl)glucosamine N-acyltransferase [Pseudolabrys sp.]|nr:UDP-3-O-(3-hydroxymyristoyl)glucosamine N-acyltransferase [Pseudolabrys sp.]